ncbi:LexA family protein [Sediminibacterium ginsengisoli]|uniref:SOS response UmuD protein. Serine peptidase. MEROPS family S24 n=1 Tax=Sediminibacterium ginsengisoli TaxID=413434 RepID=A0A1T4JU96_9BACT|nr:translesion error-prone DNA polymerase V autoproteolytic subunit [Sediminibacterium ginsengisoli]SJZ33746.1 SOS response UmuD protein. Serine peptidase. MEROPS family S24 [Sediminibacterium ginsengisoli]
MDGEEWYGAAYKGSKKFNQWEIPTANATGFGAASDDYMERGIDLNEQLIRNKPATFFFRMNSDAMSGAGIFSGDVLVVDRSIKATSGKIIVAACNGELLVRRLKLHIKGITLLSENSQHKDIQVDEFAAYAPWGVVTYAIHPLG